MNTAAQVESLINEGISELKVGHKDAARQLLSQAVRTDPESERAWLYLSAALPPAQAIESLHRVLTINPHNQQAARAIEALNNRATAVPGPGDDIPTSVPPALRNTPLETANVPPPAPGAVVNAPYPPDDPDIEEQPYSPYAPQPSERAPQFDPRPASFTNYTEDENDIAMPENTNPFEQARLDRGADSGGSTASLGRPLEVDEPGDDLRSVLTQPYVLRKQPKRRSGLPLLLGGLLLLLIAAGAAAYFLVFAPAPEVSPPATLPTAVANVPATTAPTTEPTTLAATVAPSPTVELPTATAAVVLLPTTTPLPPVLNLQVVQNQPAKLNAFNITFSSYDNHSANFGDGGAGKSRTGTHFEGAVVVIENTFNKVLPVSVKQFQAIDGRNNYAAALDAGRLPALDVTRLQPGERRAAWLTFEVGDGTTLRAILFSPGNVGDEKNTVLVNLVAPVFKGNTPPANKTAGVTGTSSISSTVIVSQTFSATVSSSDTVTVTNGSSTLTVTATVTTSAIGKRETLNNAALTVLAYNPAPNVRPFILPSGYHYESAQIRVENTDASKDISEYLKTFPFIMRDGDGFVYTIGPLTSDGPEHFDPAKFAATAKTPAVTKLTGTVYFLVRDSAKNQPRTLVWYAGNDLEAQRVEVNLKG